MSAMNLLQSIFEANLGGQQVPPPMAVSQVFRRKYHAYSPTYWHSKNRDTLESSDKIVMPASALEELSRMDVEFPIMFKISHDSKISHCSVMEFTAPEGSVYLPTWMINNLGLDPEGDSVIELTTVSLPKGTFVQFQPHETKFAMLDNPMVVLEVNLRAYSCLTVGDTIQIEFANHIYKLDVAEVKPNISRGNAPAAISIIDSDIKIVFEEPRDHKEREKKEQELNENPYKIGDALEIKDIMTDQWIKSRVMERDNDNIIIGDCSSDHSQKKLHNINDQSRIRPITDLCPNEKVLNTHNLPYQSHMELFDAYKLKIGDRVDHRDKIGRFCYAKIVDKKGTNLKIHYNGWSKEWDIWSDFTEELDRFAAAKSISGRPKHRFELLRIGDYVDVNPLKTHPGWKGAEIKKFAKVSGQIKVVYAYNGENYIYWVHGDNKEEIAEFASKTGAVDIYVNSKQKNKDEEEQKEEIMHVPVVMKMPREDDENNLEEEKKVEGIVDNLVDNPGDGGESKWAFDRDYGRWSHTDFKAYLEFIELKDVDKYLWCDENGDDISGKHITKDKLGNARWCQDLLHLGEMLSQQLSKLIRYRMDQYEIKSSSKLDDGRSEQINQGNLEMKGNVIDINCEPGGVEQVYETWLRGIQLLNVDWKKNEEIEYDSDPDNKERDGKIHKHKGNIVAMNKSKGTMMIKDENGGYCSYGLLKISIKHA